MNDFFINHHFSSAFLYSVAAVMVKFSRKNMCNEFLEEYKPFEYVTIALNNFIVRLL